MKLFFRIIGALLVLAIVYLIFNFGNIQRLLRVNSLFDEDKIVHNFSNMRDALYAVDIKAEGPAHKWEESLADLPSTVLVSGETVNLQEFLEETRTTALLVIQNGQIKYENYFLETGQDDLRISWSVAKSFLSVLIGIAVENGDIKSIDDPVIKYVPTLKGSAYEGSTIRHVLNMSSGIAFNEDYYDKNSDINKMGRILAFGRSMDDFAISMDKLDRVPGTARYYVSIDTHVLGMVLRAATGQSATDYFQEKLWSKIGPGSDAYYLSDKNGIAFVLGGLNIRTRDYALFGQLMLQEGNWKGEQIIPVDWVRESTRPSANPPLVADGFDYGYQWWMTEDSTGDYFASGIYGQQIYIDPATRTVIVKNSAHIDFNRPSPRDRHYKLEAIDMFRSIAQHYALAQ